MEELTNIVERFIDGAFAYIIIREVCCVTQTKCNA